MGGFLTFPGAARNSEKPLYRAQKRAKQQVERALCNEHSVSGPEGASKCMAGFQRRIHALGHLLPRFIHSIIHQPWVIAIAQCRVSAIAT